MSRKSVLMIVNRYPATYGHTTVIDNLCYELKKKGYKVAIGAFHFDKKPPHDIEFLELKKWKLLINGIDSLEYDIIHIHQTLPSYFVFFKKSNKQKFFHFHGASNKLQEINFKIFMKFYGDIFTKIISVSNSGITQINRMIGNVNSTVLYNGVNVKFFNDGIGSEYKKGVPELLFVSALRKYKQTDVLLNLMPELLKKYPDAHLQVVGDGEEFEKLNSKIKLRQLEKHVELAGRRDHDELKDRYASCDIYISASTFEVCPVPTLEAMACGKPLVLYDIEPHQEIISNSKAGAIFSTREPQEIIKKITDVYNNRHKLETVAREFAKENDWEEICKKLIKIYEGDEV